MKIEGYEEISYEEFTDLPEGSGLRIYDYATETHHYFKKAQKFPIVFEDKEYKIEVEKDIIRIIGKNDGDVVSFAHEESFPLLVKAVETAKEIIKKNEN